MKKSIFKFGIALISLAVVTGGLSSTIGLQSVEATTFQKATLPASSYKDFNPNTYWAEPMEWAISNGVIKGYQDKNGNYLKPNENVTEAQWVTILLRQVAAKELATADQTHSKKWWAGGAYHVASKYKFPVNGSIANPKSANQTITRGKLAQILASFVNKTQMTEKEAIAFLYDNKITSERPDRYRPERELTRAEAVSFIYRYANSELNKELEPIDGTPASMYTSIIEPIVKKYDEKLTIGSLSARDGAINGTDIMFDGITKVAIAPTNKDNGYQYYTTYFAGNDIIAEMSAEVLTILPNFPLTKSEILSAIKEVCKPKAEAKIISKNGYEVIVSQILNQNEIKVRWKKE